MEFLSSKWPCFGWGLTYGRLRVCQGWERPCVVLVSPFAALLLRGQKRDPRHLCIESSLHCLHYSLYSNLMDQLSSLSPFLPFLHFKDKFSTHGLKQGPGQRFFLLLSTLSTNSLPKIKYPFGVRRTSSAPLQLLGRACFPTRVSPPQAFLTLNVPQPLQGEGGEYEGEVGVVSKFLLFPEP